MENKVKINAMVSYMFLGPIILLAKNNPNFSDTFIRKHAKNATKIQIIFITIILFYEFFIAEFLYINIPILIINIHNIVEISLFLFFSFLLIRGAYKAFKGKEVEDIKIRQNYLKIEEELSDSNLSETSKMIYIASFIPFFGLIVANKNNLEINRIGTKLGSIFGIIMIFMILNNKPTLLLALGFLYILIIVYAGVMLIINSKIIFSSFILSFPSLDEGYIKIRAFFNYFLESFLVIFGKKEEINFEEIYKKIKIQDKKFYELTNTYLNGNSIAFKYLIFIPIINLIYIPKYLFDKKSRFVLAIAQGIVISALFGIIWYYKGTIYSETQLILLFPIFLGLANVSSNPFFRIPFIYEIYSILDKLSFGLFSKVKFLKEKKNEIKEVSFKV